MIRRGSRAAGNGPCDGGVAPCRNGAERARRPPQRHLNQDGQPEPHEPSHHGRHSRNHRHRTGRTESRRDLTILQLNCNGLRARTTELAKRIAAEKPT